jgi:transcriptional regulator with XRE-family HTH domain
MQIGRIIHKIRKERKMTLLELSKKSGVALATLSRMENGKMTGTVESHMQICAALGIELPDLYRDLVNSTRKIGVDARKTRTDLFLHDKRTSSQILAPNVLNKKMMPSLIRLAKGGLTQKEETGTGIEKFVYLLEGKIEADIGGERYALTKGDTLYFEGAVSHCFRNTGSGEARFICVTTPPAI